MKEEVLSVDNIQIQERSCDWKSAIETGVEVIDSKRLCGREVYSRHTSQY